ncbi:MAG: DUF3372 domain-containing protein, partial [Pararheinheimera sp.]|nr:DUF3372 domain-containing protein [Rheinheimera sp.]
MLTITQGLKLGLIGWAALMLAACGGGGEDSVEGGKQLLTCSVPQIPNEAGTACIAPPPIKCLAPQFPDAKNEKCIIGYNPDAPKASIYPGPNQAILFYNRADKNYTGYKLHTWNNEACDAYESSSIAASWDNGLVHTGVDDIYGAYWVLELKDGVAQTAGACANFIIHIGTDDAG